jgi:hypothetical protein
VYAFFPFLKFTIDLDYWKVKVKEKLKNKNQENNRNAAERLFPGPIDYSLRKNEKQNPIFSIFKPDKFFKVIIERIS